MSNIVTKPLSLRAQGYIHMGRKHPNSRDGYMIPTRSVFHVGGTWAPGYNAEKRRQRALVSKLKGVKGGWKKAVRS